MAELIMTYGPFALLMITIGCILLIILVTIKSIRRRKKMLSELEALKNKADN